MGDSERDTQGRAPSPREATGDLDKVLEPSLEVIDQALAKGGNPVYARPLAAAMRFVEEAVVSVSGGSKDEYLSEDWFGEIVREVTQWYANRYGWALLEHPQSSVPAVVWVHDTPFRVDVPVAPEHPGPEPGMVTLHFTPTILDSEDPRQWFVNPPRIAILGPLEQEDLLTDLHETSRLTRSISHGLGTSVFEDPGLEALATSVKAHISSAVQSICDQKAVGASLALWEIHLAVEKTLKLCIAARGETPESIHDLPELLKDASRLGLPRPPAPGLAALTSSSVAIQHRYVEIPSPSQGEVRGIYRAALALIAHCAGSFESGFLADRGRITIQALPWHPNRKGRSEKSGVEGENVT